MLCERCKIREANIQYTEVINGIKTEHHFCAHCAREMDFGPYAAIFDSDFPLGKLLSGLLGTGEEKEEQEKVNQVVGPGCKMSYENFIENSQFGCPECYGVFDLLIGEKIRQIQGSDTHKGKQPKYHYNEEGRPFSAEDVEQPGDLAPGGELNTEEQIRILESRLHEAIVREEFELAAKCRDKIKELKEGIGKC